MGTNAQPGIFLGWHMKSGCKWSGTYLIALKEDFDESCVKKTKHIPYYRVKEVFVIGDKFEFPLKEAYEKARRGINLVAPKIAEPELAPDDDDDANQIDDPVDWNGPGVTLGNGGNDKPSGSEAEPVSYTHLRAHET